MLKHRIDRVAIGKGFYILIIFTLFTYIVVDRVSLGHPIGNTLLLYLLITDTFFVITSIALLQNLNRIDIEVVQKDVLTSVEGMELGMKIIFSHSRIFRFIVINNIEIKSDRGLWISRWRINDEGYIDLYVAGYPGMHKVYGYRIEVSTPLSIHRAELNIDFDIAKEIRFAPTKHVPRFNIELVLPYLQIFEGRSSKRRGIGAEVMSIREFTSGDDYRRIHWKATARVGKLMVKEYEHKVYRNALVIVSIHKEFFIGEPAPLLYLVKLVIDVVESLLSKGMNIVLGVITERNIKISTVIDRSRLYEVYRILSEIEWLTDVDRYSSSNRLLRWFTHTVVRDVCREPCVVFLVVDPLDSMDIDSIANIYRTLNQQKHKVKVLLTTPLAIRFMYTARVEIADVDMLQKEATRLKNVIHTLKVSDVYLPTAYLKF
ncbi:MAG: DUF58 domain-containing protein [Ignisphaera sp.]